MGQHLELLARLLVGTLLASLIGYERDLHGRPAGLRTQLESQPGVRRVRIEPMP